MTYDIYKYIFIGAAIPCGIMFILSVLLFIFLKIPKVISDLTGATARKAIKNIRAQNEASGNKAYKGSAVNEARGKLTDKISPSGNIIQKHQAPMYGINTSKISTQQLHIDEADNQTSVLGASEEPVGETSLLGAEEPIGETSVLTAAEASIAETSVLNPAVAQPTFCVEFEITYIHTNEVIT